MAYGDIKSPPPQLVKLEHEVANSVASTVAPMAQGDVFDQLKATGMYESQYSRPISTMGTKVNNLSALQKQLMTQTPTEMAARTGVRLPNLGRAPKQGIASSPMQRSIQSMQEVAGGLGDAATPGNTKYVDDKGWKVTLQEILGSKLLSNEQLKKASIQNVRNLIQVQGGTQQQQEEVRYMFQRMMLEGFMRGVDITKDIEKNGAPVVELYDYAALGVSRHSGAKNKGVVLDLPFWNKSDEMNKYMLFVHEMGHQLLNKNHTGIGMTSDYGIMNQRINSHNAKQMMSSKEEYNRLMNDLFSSRASNSYNHLKTTIANNANPYFEKDWFPSLSGISSGYAPSSGGVGVNVNANVQYSNPQTLSLSDNPNGGNKGKQGTEPVNTNPAAPVGLSEEVTNATKTFANGMADLSKAPVQQVAAPEIGNLNKVAA